MTVKVNMDKLDDAHIVKGARGRWLDLILIPTPNNAYGYDNMVVQAVTKKAREKGQRGAIVGNTRQIVAGKKVGPSHKGA